ncbi:hypothetical protein HUG17_6629 [Dermatophagoides farinae]|uniref:Retrovirus-related Pol polyprotein from transposon TNT 1-94-like beta-barrel domain-containing protein n=1 Tax=Dermatophagoides farinae TaxID=6954 RepID=A0A9D4P5E3_DERFA|nr:hypothetical protein HUG17_6629 [Dermatophagoides farinae]
MESCRFVEEEGLTYVDDVARILQFYCDFGLYNLGGQMDTQRSQDQVTKYDGVNIKEWSSSVRSAFLTCGKEHFLRSELPTGHPEYSLYQRYFGLMKFTFQPKVRDHVEHLKTVFQLWDYMTRFEKDNRATAVRKYIKLVGTKYEGGELRLWLEQLTARFEDVESEWLQNTENSRCTIIISMLPRPKFERLADRLTSRDSLTMKDIMNAFIEEDEKMKTVSSKHVSNQSVNAMKKKFNKKSSSSSKRNDVKCDYCKRNGHTTDDCHKRFWDEHHKSSTSSSSSQSNSKPSTSSSSASSKSSNAASTSKHSAKSVILKNVCNTISDSWILDSGSTTHVTFNESVLVNAKSKRCEFEAAGGEPIISTKTGDTVIHPNDNELMLKNVACGDFNANLISVSQLMSDGYSVFFDGQSPDKTAFIIKNHDINIVNPIVSANQSSVITNDVKFCENEMYFKCDSSSSSNVDQSTSSSSSFINPRFLHDNNLTSDSDSDSDSVIDNTHDSSTIPIPASFSSSSSSTQINNESTSNCSDVESPSFDDTSTTTNSDAIDHHMLPHFRTTVVLKNGHEALAERYLHFVQLLALTI